MTETKRNSGAFWALVACIVVLVTVGGAADIFHKQEQRHLEEAAFYRDALLQSGSAVVVVDYNGRIEQWSEGAENMYGWTESEAVGYGLGFVIPAEMREDHMVSFRAYVKQWYASKNKRRSVQEIDCVTMHKDGTEFGVLINTRVFEREGHPVFFSIIDRADDVRRVEM